MTQNQFWILKNDQKKCCAPNQTVIGTRTCMNKTIIYSAYVNAYCALVYYPHIQAYITTLAKPADSG